VRNRIQGACGRSRRESASVELVAVTKKASLEAVENVARSGLVRYLGENRVQEAARKIEGLKAYPDIGRIRWRMIGNLQTNKATPALEIFESIDSLDSLNLAAALEAKLAQTGRHLPVLV